MPIEETDNEIRARIRNPGHYDPDSFRRGAFPPDNPEKGVFAIYGCPKGEWKNNTCQVGVQIQAFRFMKDEGWTLTKAQAWLKTHGFEEHRAAVAVRGATPSMEATLARMLRHLVARAKELNVAGMARDAIMTEVIADGANLINSALVATFLQGKEREISGAGVKTPPTMRDSDRAEIKRMSDKYLADFKKIVEDALAGVES